jgi:hypothetical protein
MATTTNRNRTAASDFDFDAATERVREAGDRFTETSRKVTAAYLDGMDRYVTGLAKAERKLGEQSQFETFSSVLKAHADLTEDVFKAGLAATRELISA